jgi:hypothetical protein
MAVSHRAADLFENDDRSRLGRIAESNNWWTKKIDCEFRVLAIVPKCSETELACLFLRQVLMLLNLLDLSS